MITTMLTAEQQQHILAATRQWIERAGQLLQRDFAVIPVVFDLQGRAAGMYRVTRGLRVIRYNPAIFARYYQDNLQQTVPHEVAHYVTDIVSGNTNVRPHGPEWRQMMTSFGVAARATCQYDLAGLPQRNMQRFSYQCDCRHHQLSAIRHNRIQRGHTYYVCQHCRTPLSQQLTDCPVDGESR